MREKWERLRNNLVFKEVKSQSDTNKAVVGWGPEALYKWLKHNGCSLGYMWHSYVSREKLDKEAEQSQWMDILVNKEKDGCSEWSQNKGTEFEIWDQALRKDKDMMKQHPKNTSDWDLKTSWGLNSEGLKCNFIAHSREILSGQWRRKLKSKGEILQP